MPSIGETGVVSTDNHGKYVINLAAVHDAIDVTIKKRPCEEKFRSYALLEKQKWQSTKNITQDFTSCLDDR